MSAAEPAKEQLSRLAVLSQHCGFGVPAQVRHEVQKNNVTAQAF
jgi:hypothetical protein